MRRCIIHIGHPKTATTYLQHCLHLNEPVFARHNYWVPGDFRAFGMYQLEPLARSGAIISGNLGPMHQLMLEGPGDLMAAMEHYVFGAPGMPPDCDVLLSSELFFYYWRAIVRLIRTAERFGLSPVIMAFLPRQDRAAVTSYLQNVRFHGFSQGVIDFLLHDGNMPYCRYMHVLQRVADHAPDTPFILRTFDRRFLRDEDVFSEFLAAVSCRVDPAECVRPDRVSNQGLLLEHYELLRAATILHRPDAVARLRDAEIPLSSADRAHVQAFYYRPGVQEFLTQSYLPGNLALLERFMPQATSAEREHWQGFDAAGVASTLDMNRFEHLRARAFAR